MQAPHRPAKSLRFRSMGPQFIKSKLIQQGLPVTAIEGDVLWITGRLAVYVNPGLRVSIMRASPVLPRTRWTLLADVKDVWRLAEALAGYIEDDKATHKESAEIHDLQALRAQKKNGGS